LMPYVLAVGSLLATFVLSAIGLIALGAGVARFTARPMWLGALRQLALGAAAAAITYAVGSAFGVGVG